MRLHAVLATFTLVLAACSGGEDPAPPPPEVRITSPEFEVHGTGPVVIQVEVEGCLPESVALLVNGVPFADLVAPYQYTWDTTWVAEGRREVTAQASCGGAAGTSAPAVIWVDRTPPAVVGRVPAPGSATSAVRDPISVTFSEPVEPATALGAISLRRGDGFAPATVTPSPDGATFTIAPTATPVAGDVLTVTVAAGVRDLAGHALPSATSWTFSYPVFVQPTRAPLSSWDGGYASAAELVLDASGAAIAAWRPGSFLATYAVTAGGAVDETLVHDVWGLDVGLGILDGEVLVVDTAAIGGGYQVRLHELAGDAFTPAGPAIGDGADARYAVAPQITFAPDGAPVVVWLEGQFVEPRPMQALRAAFLEGGAWSQHGAGVLNAVGGSAARPAVARDSAGRPAIAFQETGSVYVKRWDGAAWTLVGPGAVGGVDATDPAIAFDGEVPYVAVTSWIGGVRVYRLEGGIWTALGGDARRDPSLDGNTPAIAMAAPGRPVIAWTEGDVYGYPYSAGSLHVSSWSGSAWAPVGGALNGGASFPAYAPALAIDAAGDPVVLWNEPVTPFDNTALWNLRLARVNR